MSSGPDLKEVNERMRGLMARTTHGRDDFEDLVIVPLFAVVVALIFGALIMLATAVDLPTIGRSFVALAVGSVGSLSAWSETLTASIPLVLASLGLGLGFRAGLFNIGAEGQLLMGGLAAVVAGFTLAGLPWIIHLPLTLLIGALVGALYAAIAGFLKATTGAHEVISTIMLNLISYRLLDWLLRQPFIQREGRSDPISKDVPPSAELPRILDFIDVNLRLHAGIFVMLAAVAFVYWMLFRSKIGFAFRASGENPDAANYAGMNAAFIIVLAMGTAGALAGHRRSGPREPRLFGRDRVRRHRRRASGPVASRRHPVRRHPVRRARGGRPPDAGQRGRVHRPDRDHSGPHHHLHRGPASRARDLPVGLPETHQTRG